MHELRLGRTWWAIGIAYALLVLAASLLPARELPANLPPDKLSHLAAYGGMMLWFAQLPGARARRFALALGLVLYGVLIEALQPLLSDRLFEHGDIVANALGVAFGWALVRTPLGRLVAALDRGFAGR